MRVRSSLAAGRSGTDQGIEMRWYFLESNQNKSRSSENLSAAGTGGFTIEDPHRRTITETGETLWAGVYQTG